MLESPTVGIGWKANKDCPLCKKALTGEPDEVALPTSVFPGIGKPYGDFLGVDDPLQSLSGKKVHRWCFNEWPLRARFVGSYLEWMTGRLRGDPERGTAYADGSILVSAPCDPEDPESQIMVLELATGATTRIRNADWSEWAKRLPPGAPLREQFGTPRLLVEAIDWRAKESTCRICMKLLGVNPISPDAFRLPVSDAWTILDPARPLRQFLGGLTHTECYAGWPKRPLFAATVTDIRFRLGRLSPQGCPWSDAHSVILLERGGEIEVTLRATGSTVLVPRDRWRDFSPPASLRPFDREALPAALEEPRTKFATAEALEAAVDWKAKEAESAKAKEAFMAELRELPIRARREGIRCPRCGRRVNDLELSEADEAAGCLTCGAALTPLDFGWQP